MAISKFVSAVVFASATVLLHQTIQVGAACFCPAVYFLPSEFAEMGAIVLRADVLSRSDANDEATYVLDITTLYAGEPDVDYGDTISFVTAASTDNCGVDLKIGGNYLLGLSSDEEGAEFGLNACSLNKPWSSVFPEEHADLAGLLDDDEDNAEDDDYDSSDDYIRG